MLVLYEYWSQSIGNSLFHFYLIYCVPSHCSETESISLLNNSHNKKHCISEAFVVQSTRAENAGQCFRHIRIVVQSKTILLDVSNEARIARRSFLRLLICARLNPDGTDHD